MSSLFEVPADGPTRRHDVSRLRKLVGVALAVCGALIVSDLALRFGFGSEPAWLADDIPVDWAYYQRFGEQVAGAEWERDHRVAQFPPRFGILLGASTVQRGPLPELMEARTSYPWLLLGLGGGSSVFGTLGRALRILENSGLHADRIVFGIHPLWLTSPASAVEDQSDAVWFLSHRAAASNFLYGWMQVAREDLSLQLGFGTWMAFTPANDPWHPAPEKPNEPRLSKARFLEHLEANAKNGRFDPSRYEPDGRRSAELAALIQRIHRLSNRVLIALLPEHATFRERMPAIAERVLLQTLRSSSPPPDIIDLRNALPDDEFVDNYHLTMKGRVALSQLLAQHLDE